MKVAYYDKKRIPITHKCHYCERTDIRSPGTNPAMWAGGFHLNVWEICDDLDQPTGKYLIACDSCEHKIEESLTLYDYRSPSGGDFAPGAMPQCSACRYRKGLVCKHPDRWTTGVQFQLAPTMKETGMEFSPHPLNFNKAYSDWHTCLSRKGITLVKPNRPNLGQLQSGILDPESGNVEKADTETRFK